MVDPSPLGDEVTGAVGLPETADDTAAPRSHRGLFIALIGVVAVILLGVAGTFVWYLNTGKPVSMLPVLNSVAPPHYLYSMYDLVQPLGVAVDDANDRVYVTQSGGEAKVAVFDRKGTRVGSLEPPKSGKDALHVPVYVAVDPANGNVYVSDRGTSAVYVYDSSGNYSRTVQPKGIPGWTPLGVAIDKDGNLLVTDVGGTDHRLYVLDQNDNVIRTLGEKEKFEFPNGVVGEPNGDVAVADANNGRVVVYGGDGRLVGALTRGDADSPLGLPRGVAMDDSQRLYVVDSSNHTVRVYQHAEGDAGTPPKYAFSFGSEGSADGMFEYPNGIAVDTKGRIYITDRENGRLQVWSY